MAQVRKFPIRAMSKSITQDSGVNEGVPMEVTKIGTSSLTPFPVLTWLNLWLANVFFV